MPSRGTVLAFLSQIPTLGVRSTWEDSREMQRFAVIVRNELTGEVVTVSVECAAGADAQVQALIQQFHASGWRKATALQPVYEMPSAGLREA